MLGDTYFGESYQSNPKFNNGTNVISEYGYDYFFGNVKYVLQQADYSIVNLETSLYSRTDAKYPAKPYSHWAYGDKTCQYLVKYGIDAVSIGNNHVMDFGAEGLYVTTEVLSRHGLGMLGAGLNDSLAEIPLIRAFTAGGVSFEIAVIGGFEYRQSYDTMYNFYSGKNIPGVNLLAADKLLSQVKYLKERNKDIFIIFYPHWGKNYKPVMDYQKKMAHELIDAGVDLIIGHGSHTVQEIELYKDKCIVYSIGNFIFNAPGRYRSTGAKPYALMAMLTVTQKDKYLKLYPVFTDNKLTDYQLRFLDEEEFEDCYKTATGSHTQLKKSEEYYYLMLN